MFLCSSQEWDLYEWPCRMSRKWTTDVRSKRSSQSHEVKKLLFFKYKVVQKELRLTVDYPWTAAVSSKHHRRNVLAGPFEETTSPHDEKDNASWQGGNELEKSGRRRRKNKSAEPMLWLRAVYPSSERLKKHGAPHHTEKWNIKREEEGTCMACREPSQNGSQGLV